MQLFHLVNHGNNVRELTFCKLEHNVPESEKPISTAVEVGFEQE
jgi:hypothetical protein